MRQYEIACSNARRAGTNIIQPGNIGVTRPTSKISKDSNGHGYWATAQDVQDSSQGGRGQVARIWRIASFRYFRLSACLGRIMRRDS